MKKQILYLNLDNVLVCFDPDVKQCEGTILQHPSGESEKRTNVLPLMKPILEATNAYQKLKDAFDTYIVTSSPLKNPSILSDILDWMKHYLGTTAYKHLIITQHMNLNKGDFLIDNCIPDDADEFEGQVIQIESQKFPNWDSILKYLLPKPKPETYTHIEEILTLELPLRKDTFYQRITNKEELESDDEICGYYEDIIERKVEDIKAGKYGNLYNEGYFDSECGWYEDIQRFSFEIGDFFDVTVDVVDVSISPDYEFNEVKAYIECTVNGAEIPEYIQALELACHCEFECLEETLDTLFTEISKCKERYLSEHCQ